MKTIEMSNYSVGESCYNEIPGVCEKYNVKKVVLIGGKELWRLLNREFVKPLKRLILLLQIQLYMVLNVL